MALSATALMVLSVFCTLNRKSDALLTIHSTVKSTSTMFSSPVSIRLSSGTSRVALPRRGSSITRMPISIGQMIVEAGLRELGELAEAQYHPLLVRLHAIEARQHPEYDRRHHQQKAAPAAERAAGQNALQFVL